MYNFSNYKKLNFPKLPEEISIFLVTDEILKSNLTIKKKFFLKTQ